MLQAQIDIVDADGNTEESVKLLGVSQVSVGEPRDGRYLHVDHAVPDLALITHDGKRVFIQVKGMNALQQGGRDVTLADMEMEVVASKVFEAFSEALRRSIRVSVAVFPGELLGAGGVVIRSTPSSLVARAQASAARGAVEVTAQLRELREQGKIDEHGNVLVPWPRDMRPDSKTDL